MKKVESNKDKMNRVYGVDYRNQLTKLNNQVDKRLAELFKNFPNVLAEPDKSFPLDVKISQIVITEKIINEIYNSQEQGNLF